jgi:NAD(P)-dependent dehydrogenase (short-subunit alcohol dehydrogenase family)
MGAPISFDGRTVIVTGAAHGLGLAYAHELARRGACVVLNDLDADRLRVATQELIASGHEAIEQAGDVTSASDMAALADLALAQTGRIDGVICNAGLLRDRTFAKMPIEDFRLIVEVHLMGTAILLHKVWPHMVKQGFGRVLLTTSTSALYGNFGQSNYDAAKLGVVGLMNALVQEGRKHDVLVNTIAPLAVTRLGSDVFSGELADLIPVASVVPVALALMAPESRQTGLIVETGGGRVALARMQRTAGLIIDREASLEDASDALMTLKEQLATYIFEDAGRAVASLLDGLAPVADQADA